MNCPHCGAQVSPANRFCNRCRRRVVPDARPAGGAPAPGGVAARPSSHARATSAPSSFERPTIVTILGVLDVIGGVLATGLGAFLVVGRVPGMNRGGVTAVIGLLYLILGFLQLATGVGLLGLKPWARTVQIGIAVIGLIGFPCGTIISILILVYMLKPEVKLLFSGVSPRQLAPEELVMVERLGQGSGAAVAIALVAVLVLGVATIGMVAAIAIPSLLRARVSANEATTISDMQTMISAQAAYATVNAGFADTPECLMQPANCLQGAPVHRPLLDAAMGAERRHGYQFRFVPGPAARIDASNQGTISRSSLHSWAYLAEPLVVGQTGVRAFCADSEATICVDADGRLGEAVAGACPADCKPL
jgi:type IV pilus assembly protein PilA